MKKPVRIGLAGLGGWSRSIVKSVEKNEKLKSISCFSRTEESRNPEKRIENFQNSVKLCIKLIRKCPDSCKIILSVGLSKILMG